MDPILNVEQRNSLVNYYINLSYAEQIDFIKESIVHGYGVIGGDYYNPFIPCDDPIAVFATYDTMSVFFSVNNRKLKYIVDNHRNEFEEDGLQKLTGREYITKYLPDYTDKAGSYWTLRYRDNSDYVVQIPLGKGLFFTHVCLIRMALLLDKSNMANHIREELIKQMQTNCNAKANVDTVGRADEVQEVTCNNTTLNLTDLEVFQNSAFGSVRVTMVNNEPWFVGKDVAEILGYGDGNRYSKSIINAINDHVEVEDKGVTKMATPGGFQSVTLINESGLYSLILSSKLPTAKAFKHWVTSEVLPTIRKTGGMVVEGREEEFIANYFPSFSEEVKLAMVQDLRSQNVKLKEANKKLEEDKAVLEKDNKALSSSILEWEDRDKLNKAVRRFAVRTGKQFSKAWEDLFDELIYKHGINLKSRKAKDPNRKKTDSYISYIREDEWSTVIETFSAMCVSKFLSPTEIFEKEYN